MKIRDNEWGFDVGLDNPFKIFRVLRNVAIDSVGVENVVDMSRGDPGYGFSPSRRGREFYAFLLEVDGLLNNKESHFVTENRDDFETLWGKIQTHAREVYAPKKADQLLEDFYFFMTRVEKYAAQQGLNWNKRDIVFEMFKYSAVGGGCYHDPRGETLVRLVVADHYNQALDFEIDYSDLLLVQGVSHGIGIIFKTLCSEEVAYLKKGDSVLLTSPAYAPYNLTVENRGLKPFSIPINPVTGKVEGDLDDILKNAPEEVKLICLIDPNNPTGFIYNEEFLTKIADFAEKKNSLIVSDEVYSDFFFERRKSILNFARKRTIVIGGRSKIERSTGLRFGEYVLNKEAQKYIAENILDGRLNGNDSLMSLLHASKAPGSMHGEFQHTTFVTGPSQYLGISHMIFGEEDRAEYLRRIRANMEEFYEILGLPYQKNLYYASFNLMDIPGNTRSSETPNQIFFGLAKKGVVLIPAKKFFTVEGDFDYFARASLPNLTFSNVQKAAKLIREYMAG